jgi:hypothetical protein
LFGIAFGIIIRAEGRNFLARCPRRVTVIATCYSGSVGFFSCIGSGLANFVTIAQIFTQAIRMLHQCLINHLVVRAKLPCSVAEQLPPRVNLLGCDLVQYKGIPCLLCLVWNLLLTRDGFVPFAKTK